VGTLMDATRHHWAPPRSVLQKDIRRWLISQLPVVCYIMSVPICSSVFYAHFPQRSSRSASALSN